MNLIDGVLTNKEAKLLTNITKNRSSKNEKESRNLCLDSLKSVGGKNLLDEYKKYQFGALDLDNASNQTIAILQFIYNLKSGSNELKIDGKCGTNTKEKILKIKNNLYLQERGYNIKYEDVRYGLLKKKALKNYSIFDKNNGVSSFLDGFIAHPHNMQSILAKEKGIDTYKKSLATGRSINAKRAITLGFILNTFKDRDKRIDSDKLANGFNFYTLQLLSGFQKGNGLLVDGLMGSSTLAEIKRRLNFEDNINKNGDILVQNKKIPTIEHIKIKECAEYVIDSIMRSGFTQNKDLFTTISGVVGNAWTMLDNIQNRGGSTIFNIFDKEANMPVDRKDESSVKKYVEGLLVGTHSCDYSKIKVGDIVGLYYPRSTNHIKAASANEQTMNTHVGYIKAIDDNGMPIVSHNVHGTVYNQRIGEMSDRNNSGGSAVAWIARPMIS